MILLPTDDIITPTEKVGCILVTSHLQQFLEDYPPSSDKQAFLDVYHMLSLLDKYLYDNLKQHTHCMSSANEYVTLLKYANTFEHRFKCVFDSLGCTLYSPLMLKMENVNMYSFTGGIQHILCRQIQKIHAELREKVGRNSDHMHDSVTQNLIEF